MNTPRFSRFLFAATAIVAASVASAQQIILQYGGATSEPVSISSRSTIEAETYRTNERVVRKKPGRTTYANITLERGWNPDCVAAVTLVNDVLQRQIDRRSGSIIILDNDGEVARAGLSEIKGVTVTFPSAGNLRRSEDPYQVSISFLGLVSQLKGVLPGSLLTHREQAAKAALSQTRSLTVGILNSDETQTPLSVSGFGGFSATERRVPVDMVEDIELLDLSNIKLQHGAQDRSRLSAWESDVKTASAAHEPVAWERAFRTLVITYWVGSRYQTQLHLTCFPISRVDVGGTSEVEYAVDKARFVVLPLAP